MADPGEELETSAGGGGGSPAGGRAQGTLRSVRGGAPEPVHRPEMAGVPAPAARGGGGVRIRPPDGRPSHSLRGGRLPLPNLRAPMTNHSSNFGSESCPC